MNTDQPPFTFEMPAASVDPAEAVRPSPGLPTPPPWWPGDDAHQAPRRDGTRGRSDSTAQRMAALRAWEFENIPMLRRRASAEVFFAVWALSGREHDTAFTAKSVLVESRISERAARLTLRTLLEDGWIQRYGNGNGNADGRLRPYRATSRLMQILVEYETRIAATF